MPELPFLAMRPIVHLQSLRDKLSFLNVLLLIIGFNRHSVVNISSLNSNVCTIPETLCKLFRVKNERLRAGNGTFTDQPMSPRGRGIRTHTHTHTDTHTHTQPLHIGNRLTGTLANSEDPDEIQHYAAFPQGLHCLLRLKRASWT